MLEINNSQRKISQSKIEICI